MVELDETGEPIVEQHYSLLWKHGDQHRITMNYDNKVFISTAPETATGHKTLPDGRLRLREEWRRFDEAGSAGVSFIEEVGYERRGLTSPLS